MDLAMGKAIWSPPEPTGAHTPHRRDIFDQLYLQAVSVCSCENGLAGDRRKHQLSPTQMDHRIMSDKAVASVQCVLHQRVTDTHWAYTFQ